MRVTSHLLKSLQPFHTGYQGGVLSQTDLDQIICYFYFAVADVRSDGESFL
jgi:hypothetical protein